MVVSKIGEKYLNQANKMKNWYKIANEPSRQRRIKEEVRRIANKIDGSTIKKYLTQIKEMKESMPMPKPEGFHYTGGEDFLLQHGRSYESQPFTEEELKFLEELAGRTCMYRMKECFFNAQDLAQTSPKIKYIEGYLYSGILPIEHAWNTLNGKVIDFTMYHANNDKPILGTIPDNWEYFGASIPTSAATSLWTEHEMATPLITNYLQGFPLLKEPFKEEGEEQGDEIV